MTPSQKAALVAARDKLKDKMNGMGSYVVYVCDEGMSELAAAIDALVPNEADPTPPDAPVEPPPVEPSPEG